MYLFSKETHFKSKMLELHGKSLQMYFKYIKMDNFYPKMAVMNVLSLIKAFFPVSELGW